MVTDREMTVFDPEIRRDPEAVVEAASKAAKVLQRVVESKPHKVMVGGKQYLQFEDWQTLAQFYGYSVRTLDAEPVTIGDVHGARARAEVVDIRTGVVVAGADAYCLSDEENWSGKPWFQLASMAQTRSGAKALRNRLAWVAVLAGYEPTPAEEMTQDDEAKPKQQQHWCQAHNVAFRRFEKEGRVWYSHKTDDGWCNEAKARETAPAAPTEPPARVVPQPASPRPQAEPPAGLDGAAVGQWRNWHDNLARQTTLEGLDTVEKGLTGAKGMIPGGSFANLTAFAAARRKEIEQAAWAALAASTPDGQGKPV